MWEGVITLRSLYRRQGFRFDLTKSVFATLELMNYVRILASRFMNGFAALLEIGKMSY